MRVSEVKREQLRVEKLVSVAEWLEYFVSQAHADLGKPGPVCPWAKKSLERDSIDLKVYDTVSTDEIKEVIEAWLENFSYIFSQAELGFAVAVSIFPNAQKWVLESVQLNLKPFFVSQKMMVGEFHPESQVTGLHNCEFRSQWSPVPLIAVRKMVPFDLPFLLRAKELNSTKVTALKAYLGLTGLSDSQKDEVINELKKIQQ